MTMALKDSKRKKMALIYAMLINSTDFKLKHIEVIRVEEGKEIEIYPTDITLGSFELMNAIQSVFGGGIGMYVDYNKDREKCFYRVY